MSDVMFVFSSNLCCSRDYIKTGSFAIAKKPDASQIACSNIGLMHNKFKL